MLNKIMIIGNLGMDPETKILPSGTTVARMRVAVSEKAKQSDQLVDHTEWFTVIAFGSLAENAAKYLSKGRQVYVEGKMRTRSYEVQGEKKYVTELLADVIRFLGSKGSAENGKVDSLPDPVVSASDEDVPF